MFSQEFSNQMDSVNGTKDKNSKDQDFDFKAAELGEEYTVSYEEEKPKVT